mmetsp:Transcript_11529/g.24575  ORF Transcript_11529/g.24575 Transcript_11529/m.24575 type:complete len:609 (-) Transcript_11529:113-1939(-)
MGGPILQYHPYTLDLAPDQSALHSGIVHTLFTTGIVLGRDVRTNAFIDKLIWFAQFFDFLLGHGFNVPLHLGVLTGTARLFLVQPIEGCFGRDSLLVVDIRLSRDAFDIVFAIHSFNVHFQVQFTHATQNRLLCFGIDLDAQCRILLCKFVQCLGEIVLHFLFGWFDGEAHDRLRYEHGTHGQIHVPIRESVHGPTINTEHGHDVSGVCFVNLLHFVRVHSYNTREFDLFTIVDVDDEISLFEHALVDAHVGKLSEGGFFQFERQGKERIFLFAGYLHGFLVLRTVQCKVWFFDRFGQVVDHAIEELLHTLVFKGRSHEDRDEFACHCLSSDCLLELFFGGFLLHQEQFANLIVHLRQAFDQLRSFLFDHLRHISRNVALYNLLALLALEHIGLHGDQIDHSFMSILQTHRNLHRGRIQFKLISQISNNLPRIAPLSVQFVNKRQSWHIVPFHLSIHRQTLRLYSRHTAKYQNTTVQYSQSAFYLNGEINVTGSIDNVDPRVLPSTEGGGGLDGDALLALEIHAVHFGTHAILPANIVDGVDPTGVVEDAFGQCGLSRVNMGGNSNVASFDGFEIVGGEEATRRGGGGEELGKGGSSGDVGMVGGGCC